jgi:predicted RNase H-like HicB family nuclease
MISREEIKKYVDMPHSIQIKQEEGGFFVSIPDLSGCMSQGDTLNEAYSMIMDAKATWIEGALNNGETIPEPTEDKKEVSIKEIAKIIGDTRICNPGGYPTCSEIIAEAVHARIYGGKE